MTGLTTDFNVSPYFDDNDSSKNFHRVLFKPEVAVQARELTQLQAILQEQIARFGNNILVEGTIIDGGNFIEETRLKYVKILDDNANNQPVVMSQYAGMFATGQASNVKAKIATISTGLVSQAPDLNTLYVVYMTTSDSGQKTFIAGENLIIQDALGNVIDTLTVAPNTLNPLGNSYGLRCGEGILFQKGFFINFVDHLIIVSKYNNVPDGVVIGFDVAEEIINSYVDTSLLDNANGFNNYTAPGADRLKLTPQLVVKSQEEANAIEGFLKIQEYENGNVVRKRVDTQFNSINKELRKRTNEESGNYALGEVPVAVTAIADDTTRLKVAIGKSVSYVGGERIEFLDTITKTIDKPTDFQIEDSQNILTNIGHYLIVSGVSGVFNFTSMNLVELRDGNSNVIGRANLRSFARHDATRHRAYVFNIIMNSGKVFSDVRTIRQGTSTGTLVLENGTPSIKDFSFKASLFSAGKNSIKSLPSADTSYVARVSSGGTVTGSSLTVSLSSGEFTYGNSATLNSDQKNEIVLFVNNTVVDLTGATVVTNSDATSLTVTFADGSLAGQAAIVIHDVQFQNVIASKKQLQSVYVKINTSTHANGVNGPYSLGLPDVLSIEGIWVGTGGAYAESGANVKDSFTLIANQKDDMYAHSYFQKSSDYTIPANSTLLVKVKVFVKDSTYSFFSVDSYPIDDTATPLANTIKTEQIPNYVSESGNVYSLRDVVDFRPYVTNTAAYATTIAAATIMVTSPNAESANATFASTNFKFCAPNKYVASSYQYYIGRQDRVMLMFDGSVEVVTGIASELPVVPSEIDGGMTLAIIKIPPFPSLDYSNAIRIGKPNYGVTLSYTKNRRYTMKDIGKIDRRLSNVEYYTLLNALEKSADSMIITDSNGLDRFKNGIIVDNFENLIIANTNHSEFSAGIDTAFTEITPKFRTYPLDMEVSALSGVVDHGQAATLTYDAEMFAQQLSATKSRSCTSGFYAYTGVVALSPEYDAEADVSQAPDVNINVDLEQAFADYTDALSDFVPLSKVSSDVVSSRNSTSTSNGQSIVTTTTTRSTTTTKKSALTVGGGTEEDTSFVGDFVRDVNFNPWLRSRDVAIYVVGLRPNTQFWFWFDQQPVTQFINPAIGNDLSSLTRQNTSNVIKTDANGVLKAIFKIPATTFKVGDRLLEMYDLNQYNSVEDSTSSASKVYSGYNFSYETSSVNVSTRTPVFDTTTTTSVSTNTSTSTSVTRIPTPNNDRQNRDTNNGSNGSSDPISQTFYIDPQSSSDTAIFLESVDVYFAKKGVNGVRLQIRETVNGYPSNTVVPFSEVVLTSAQVSVSDNSSIATTFSFPAPISLKTGEEYAITVIPVANDPDYRVWVSKIGEVDLLDGTAVTQDVASGTLFTSTNSSAWTAYQTENLKYSIRRCLFNVANGVLTMKPKNYEFLSISNIVGNFVSDEIVFEIKTNAVGNVAVSAGNNTITGTGTQFSSTFAVQDYIVIKTGADTYEPLRITGIANNTTMTVASVPYVSNANATYFLSQVGTVDYFNRRTPPRIHLKNSSARSGNVFTANTTIVGATSKAAALVTAVENQKISYLQPHVYRTDFAKTRTTLKFNTNGESFDADFNDNKYLTSGPHYVFSRSNEIVAGVPNQFSMDVTLQNTSATTKDTSPFVDHEISGVAVYEYALGGSQTASYVSKVVQLSDELDAEDFKLFLTGYRPNGTDLEVSVKFLAGTDPVSINQVPWTKLEMKGENNFFSSLSNRFDYKEFEYFIGSQAKGNGEGAWSVGDTINYLSDGGAKYTNFKYFVIKLTMKSDTFYRVPRIADMRGIALS